MTRKINNAGLNHIKQWEGLRLQAYKDVVGIWTIGYGHTAAAGQPAPKAGMEITAHDATNILMSDLEQYEHAVDQSIKVKLNDSQFAALVSFTYNVGIGAFLKSTLLKKLNKGNYESIPNELMKWIKSGGNRIQGLVNRRRAECALWIKGDFVSSNYVKPTADKNNSILKPEVIAPIIGAASGLTGFVTGNGPIQWAMAVIMIIAAVGGVAYFIKHIKDVQA